MSADILQLSSWVNGPHFINNSIVPFVPNKDVINNIKLNSAPTKQSLWKTLYLWLHLSKSRQLPFLQWFRLITPVPSMFPFDKFSSYQKFFRIAAYVLRFCLNTPATVTLLVALLTLISYETERKDFLDNKSVKRSSRIVPH